MFQWEVAEDYRTLEDLKKQAVTPEDWQQVTDFELKHPYTSEATAENWSDNYNNYEPATPYTIGSNGEKVTIKNPTNQQIEDQRKSYLQQALEVDARYFSGTLTPEDQKDGYLNITNPGIWDVS